MKKISVGFISILMGCSIGSAAVQTASLFSDNMVLQRGRTVPVWGTGEVGESVSVSFSGQNKTTTVDGLGKWRVDLDPLVANTNGQSLVVAGSFNTVTWVGVLIGDVWLASGQSNMKFRLNQCVDDSAELLNLYPEVLVQADNSPLIRYFKVPIRIEMEPQDSVDTQWELSSSAFVESQSAIAVIFSQQLQPEIGVPLGVIIAAEGSTAAECWVSNETWAQPPFDDTKVYWDDLFANWETEKPKLLQKELADFVAGTQTWLACDIGHPSTGKTYPTGCYNGMLNALFPYALTGVVWRQGEANWERAEQYVSLMETLLVEWRTNFENPTLPFIQLQLPEQRTPESIVEEDNMYSELREAQDILARTGTNVEMAVLIDVNDPTGNVHPRNKLLDGYRAALVARAQVYGEAIEWLGPVCTNDVVEGSTIRLYFDHVSGGFKVGTRLVYEDLAVTTNSDPIANFAIAGSDQVFYPATATIDGNTLVVSSASVPNPVAVRYAWSTNPTGCNLYNSVDLPAAPFRTDDWPKVTAGVVDASNSFWLWDKDCYLLKMETAGTGTGSIAPAVQPLEFLNTQQIDTYAPGTLGVYPMGSSIDLTAIAELGSILVGWSEDASGTGTNITVVLDTNKWVVATFGEDSVNYPPVFDADPIFGMDAAEGEAYVETLAERASDPNGDPLTFGLVSGGSAWLQVTTNGVLSGIPGAVDVGSNTWTVLVMDDRGGTNQAELVIRVLEAGAITVKSFGPTDDTFVYKKYGDNNYGSDSSLLVRTQGGNLERRGFIQFDLGSLQGTVTSAKLKLYSEGISEEIFLNSVSDHSWSEGTLTWNNAPWESLSASPVASVVATAGSWVEVDLTASITNAGIYGFTLEAVNGDNDNRITSKEGGANAPVLEVTTVADSLPPVFPPVVISGILPINAGTEMVLQWPGVVGDTYSIMSNTNLSESLWSTNRAGIAGVEPLNVETVSVSTAYGFYRIEQTD